MGRFIDIVGQKFGKLTVVSFAGTKSNRAYFVVQCDCGSDTKEVVGKNLRNGNTTSCGCNQKLRASEALTKHGMAKRSQHHPLYSIFHDIKKRTTNSNHKSYTNYGGRGIKCEWESFEVFYKDMIVSYELHLKEHGKKNTTIERDDVDGNYSLSNCSWATMKEQGNNKRNNILVEINGLTNGLLEWSKLVGISYETLLYRFHKGLTGELLIQPTARQVKQWQ